PRRHSMRRQLSCLVLLLGSLALTQQAHADGHGHSRDQWVAGAIAGAVVGGVLAGSRGGPVYHAPPPPVYYAPPPVYYAPQPVYYPAYAPPRHHHRHDHGHRHGHGHRHHHDRGRW